MPSLRISGLRSGTRSILNSTAFSDPFGAETMSVTCVADYIHPEPTSFFRKYIWSYDHKIVGKQYLWTSLIFLILGGTLAMLLRWQISYPGSPVPFVGNLLKNSFFFGSNGEI